MTLEILLWPTAACTFMLILKVLGTWENMTSCLIQESSSGDLRKTHRHQPPDQVAGVRVLVLGPQLGGVELGGAQDLQHTVQGLGHWHRAALLGRVDDVDHLDAGKAHGR